MTSDTIGGKPRAALSLARFSLSRWPVLGGFLVLAIPTILRLAQQSWTLEIGAHGPIVLATGIWLLLQARVEIKSSARTNNGIVPVVGMVASLGLYIFGRAYDFLALEAIGCYGAFLSIVLREIGFSAMRGVAFPLLYLAFLIPPPGWVIDQITAPLQTFVSATSTDVLAMFGYPISRNGVVIFIAQYQLLVEQACAGMNSLIGLTAITLFYIYMLHRSSWRYALLLGAIILPIAVLTNMVRVIALVLVTYYLGDAAAQGFLHATTGMLLFAVALGLMVATDSLLQLAMSRRVRT